MRSLAGLLLGAAGLRLALVLRGGQYFDWDEYRYGFAMLMFGRLREGDVNGMLDILFRYPEHPGFKIIGMIPAAFHAAIAGKAGHPMWDMRYPTGEWLPAFILSLASVCSIGLTFAIARRSGAGRDESLLAAFLMFASTTQLIHARHFFPYDLALAGFLLALWLAMADRPRESFAAGVLCGAALAAYEGYWLLVIAIALLHLTRGSLAPGRVARRGCLFAVGFSVVPALLVTASAYRGRDLIDATRQFSRTVTHGSFSEGWSLPWAYFWHAEHVVLFALLAGIGLAIVRRSSRGILWTSVTAGVYLGLVIGSNVFERFVVYDRLARQMWPFLCLGAAAGLSELHDGRWVSGRRACWLYGGLSVLFAWNTWPLMTQRYPREIVGEVIAKYGSANVSLDTSLLHAVDATSAMFLPLEQAASASGPRRYVLLNARDIWIDGELGVTPDPKGTVVASWRHPRQLQAMQYHGYTPEQRAFLRTVDPSIRLIDTMPP